MIKLRAFFTNILIAVLCLSELGSKFYQLLYLCLIIINIFFHRCHTDFCYRCGKRHRKAGLLGDHYSTYSFLGCKYNLAPNKPFVRVAVRSGVLMGAVIATPIALSLVAVAGAAFLAVSPIVVPVCYFCPPCKSRR